MRPHQRARATRTIDQPIRQRTTAATVIVAALSQKNWVALRVSLRSAIGYDRFLLFFRLAS
jgi:hypothetical protein